MKNIDASKEQKDGLIQPALVNRPNARMQKIGTLGLIDIHTLLTDLIVV
jgi:hypothetical protein